MSFLWAVFKGIFSVTFVEKAITQGNSHAVWRYRRNHHGKVRQPEPRDSRHSRRWVQWADCPARFCTQKSNRLPGRHPGASSFASDPPPPEPFSLIGALIYSILTISLRANQNVTGLALTTFGVGFGNFLGGSFSKITGTAGQTPLS